MWEGGLKSQMFWGIRSHLWGEFDIDEALRKLINTNQIKSDLQYQNVADAEQAAESSDHLGGATESPLPTYFWARRRQ